jgi:hypothetical protein
VLDKFVNLWYIGYRWEVSMNKAKRIIQEKGITEGMLIDAGFSAPTVEKIMRSDDWPAPKTYKETLVTVARVLGVSVNDLLSDNNKGE